MLIIVIVILVEDETSDQLNEEDSTRSHTCMRAMQETFEIRRSIVPTGNISEMLGNVLLSNRTDVEVKDSTEKERCSSSSSTQL